MRAVIMHAHGKDETVGRAVQGMLCAALRARGWETQIEPLAEMQIRPCAGCFNCWLKTPGQCAIDDDGREVARAIANCDVLVFLSEVTFGGYSSRLKCAVDRIIPTISPLFEKVNGEMHHKLRYPAHSFLAVGWQDEPDAAGAGVFTRLAARNAINMHAPVSGSAVLHGGQSRDEQRALVTQLVEKLEAHA